MNLSLRDISQIIDPLEPPTSLKEVAKRHRWMSGNPPNSISMWSITDRYSDPTNIIRFLSYNTFLLDGFEIPLNLFDLTIVLEKVGTTVADYFATKLEIGIEDMMGRFGIDPMNILSARWSAKSLAGALGISWGVVLAATGGAAIFADPGIGVVLKVAGIICRGSSYQARRHSLEILEIAGKDPLTALVELGITVGTILGVDIPDPIAIGAKPALTERSQELGPKLMEPMNLAYGLDKSYEIIALCEVWYQEARDQLAAASPQCVHITGPDATGPKALKGSGLYQIVLNHAVLEQPPPLVFSNRGDELRDADAWASKGVLLTRIDVGVGVIDLYSTHLYSGDGLLDIPKIGLGKLPEGEKSGIRNSQLDEFIAWFKDTHNSSNIAIFCGDFNISGNNYGQNLIDVMKSINMENVALRPRFKWNTYGDTGGTHGDENPDPESSRFNEICDLSVDSTYCRDPNGNPGGDCIDYIFVERPTSDHTFNLDISRLRRRLFLRDEATDGQISLSDHLGLYVTLIASKCKC